MVTFYDRQLGFAYKKVRRDVLDEENGPRSVAVGAKVRTFIYTKLSQKQGLKQMLGQW